MKIKHRQSGLSLMEEVVVVAIIAMLVFLGLPAIRAFTRSVESGGSARAMISAALASGRAIASKEHRYAGVRFQNKFQEDGKGCQYMIFIVYDPCLPNGAQGNLGCRAVENYKPVKLPDSVGVMDLKIADVEINTDPQIDMPAEVNDTTTFSILFSPSGKLVTHNLWVRNRDGDTGNGSKDDIFNTESNVKNGIGMFIQDESTGDRQRELSRNSFIIYDKAAFEKLNSASRYTDYLDDVDVIYINPYTGTMIEK
jgi:type II secretory pathway pseudopilin PulG